MNEIEIIGRAIEEVFVAIDPSESDRSTYEEIRNQYDEELKKRRPELQKFFYIESSLVKLYPLPLLRQTAIVLRQRFALLVGQGAYQQYLDADPPDIKTAPRDDLLADSQAILKQIHDIYSFQVAREEVISKIKLSLIGVTSIVVITSLYLVLGRRWPLPILLLITDFGMIGALMSVFQRLQILAEVRITGQDPMLELISLRYGGVGILFSLILGSVFALLLYILFLSDIVPQGGMFPDFKYPDDAPKNGVVLEDLFKGRLASQAAYAKALVYAFIAGFAERLVPDILAQIVQRSTENKS